MTQHPCDESLGEFLAKLRRRKGISQKKLAELLKWKGTAPIVSIEKGRRKPSPETLIDWVDALKGSDLDRHFALGLAGYLPNTQLPPLATIIEHLARFALTFRDQKYPCYIVDYQLTLWVINPLTKALMGDLHPGELLARHVNLFDVFFNGRLGIPIYATASYELKARQIERFKVLNIHRHHEPFFCAYPEYMRGRLDLSDADYAQFEQAWHNTSVETASQPNVGLVWSLPAQKKNGAPLYFETVPQPIFALNNCFVMATHQPYNNPDDPENVKRVEGYLDRFRPADDPSFTLWESSDAQSLLDSYALLKM